MDIDQKRRELAALRARLAELEAQVEAEEARPWQATRYYAAYYATTGFMLGGVGALASLFFNVVGSLLVGQHPLRLIQVYLTFPLGEEALRLEGGLALAVGCCLYIATGMLYGIVFQLVLARWAPEAGWRKRLILASGLALAIWLVNFYGILSWVQPLFFGGRWILTEIPFWVAAATHLVFGWTMALAYPLGTYSPYKRVTDA
jgi:hypothetical protein